MITLPKFKQAFAYENNFYLSCDVTRMAKMIAHHELYKLTAHIPGVIVECGVFKGNSLVRFAMFRAMYGPSFSKKIIGFDIFDTFPDTDFVPDKSYREQFIKAAGSHSISTEQLMQVLKHKHCHEHVELIAGDICETVPRYLGDQPHLTISLLNLDTDIYEPAVVILEHLWPRLARGGIMILDDYGVFPGETKAVNDYFQGRDVTIRKFPYAMTPSYIIKR